MKGLALLDANQTMLYGLPENGPRSNSVRKQNKRRWEQKISHIDVSQEEFNKILLEVKKMQLSVPTDTLRCRRNCISGFEEQLVAKQLASHSSVCASVEVREGEPTERECRIAEYIRKSHEDYDGKVLCEEVPPDPPVRGPYGYAYIPLKEGAEPQRQKPFYQHGERVDAMKKITDDWISKKFIERPTAAVEWLCQGFAVPQKSTTFPWRGVVDMRGVNNQTRQCNYPLPNIENILVKLGKNKLFSIFDSRGAFHQQPLRPDSRPLT